jgi:proteasome lid subunit RPN8/RPN11
VSKGKSERRVEPAAPSAAGQPGAFPGGKSAPEPGELRIAVDKRPYAEIIGHAVLEPDVEVCGVLVGRVGEDEHGRFVHVTAAIRGQAAKQEGAAVTFTHETWNHIHQEMDARHPDAQIVGWYHTHGGFGVFLSEMDTFVHRNFFPEPFHLAYVYDPLAGSEAFFHPRGAELVAARRYWLAGRERRPVARQPEPEPRPAVTAGPPPEATSAAALERAAAALQLAQARQGAGGLAQYAPWLLAAALAGVLLLSPRSPLSALGGAAGPEPAPGPVLVLDVDPESRQAIGIPLEALQVSPEGLLVDASGRPRLGVTVKSADQLMAVITALRPTPEQRAVAEREREARRAAAQKELDRQRAERAMLLRILGWAGLGLGGVALLAGGAWWLLQRRH